MNFFVLFLDVDQFLGSVTSVLGSLIERFTSSTIADKLGSSILATVFRQLVMDISLLNINYLRPGDFPKTFL